MSTVTIKNGTRFGKPITGTFPVSTTKLKLMSNPKGESTLYCPVIIDDKNVWIAITSEQDVEFDLTEEERLALESSEKKATTVKEVAEEVIPEEPEETALERIRVRFDILQRLVRGVLAGAIKALVISGPAGVGKSHGVETELQAQAELSGYRHELIKGTASAIYVYQKLYEYKDEKDILVFDDVDSVFYDPITLNIFKAALDSSKKRVISWGTNSRILKELDIPNSFEFKGAVIFITNLKFDRIRSESLKDHLLAIESRCHYLDLTVDSPRDKILRIKQVVRDSSILTGYGFEEAKREEIVQYISDNSEGLRELSLRTIKKLADLAIYTSDWKEIADITCKRRVINSN